MAVRPLQDPRRFLPGDPRAQRFATHVDPRTRTRTVPMKVVALGVPRTGTYALRQALLDLGYNNCYHFSVVLQEYPRDAEMWVEAMEAKFEGKGQPFGRKDWDQLLGEYMAVTDTPTSFFSEELLEAYPEAKVILTVRDNAEQWNRSVQATIMKFVEGIYSKSLWGRIRGCFLPFSAVDRLCLLLVKHCIFKDVQEGRGIQAYEYHNAEIQRIVPKDRLLVMNVKDGWKPLCDFLGHDIPAHAFPMGNDTAAFKKNSNAIVKILNTVAILKIAGLAATAIAAGVGIWWRFYRS